MSEKKDELTEGGSLMYKTAEELGNSFPLFQELIKEGQLIRESTTDIEKRFQIVNSELDEVKKKRGEILKLKVLGKATDKELKSASDAVEQKEKEFSQMLEEKETISNLQNFTAYSEDEIREAYSAFTVKYYKETMKPLEEEVRAAKEAYMLLFNQYYQAVSEYSRFQSWYAGCMINRKMNSWLPHIKQGDRIFVDPTHLKDKFYSY